MGRRKLAAAVVVVSVLVAAGLFLRSDKRAIRRQLDAIASAASAAAGETEIERVARAARLGRLVTEGVIVRHDASSFVGGRQAVVEWTLQGAAAYGAMTVSLADVEISLVDAQTAAAFLTLTVTGDNRAITYPEPRQVHATFAHVNGEWLLSEAEVLRTLEPAQ